MRWRLLLILIATGVTSGSLRAQPVDPAFEVITTSDGLPSNTVLSAASDHEGFMWFGTRAGPVRYDGSSFRRYTEVETNFVTGLVPDGQNNMWFASDLGGVGWIDARTRRMHTLPETQKRGQTGELFIDSHGAAWYSDMKGVNRLDIATGDVRHYPFKPNAFVWVKASFVEDATDSLWVISRDNGLFRYDRQRDSLVSVWGPYGPETMASEVIQMLHAVADEKGRLWIATYNAGILMYDTYTGKHRNFYPERGSAVTAIARGMDDDGRTMLWVGTDMGIGTFIPDEERFHFFSGIMDEPFRVNSIFCDSVQNLVWACTSAGIVKYHPDRNIVRTVRFPSTFPVTESVQVVQADRQHPGRYFLGLSGSGIVDWNRNTHDFRLIPLPARMEVRWMLQRSDGKMLVGGNRWDYIRPGIFLFDPQSGQFSKTPFTEAANQKFSVPFFMYAAPDGNGNIYIGNSDEGIHGIKEADGTEITPWSFNLQQKLINNTNLINDILFDRNGSLRLGTHNGIYEGDIRSGTFRKAGGDTAVHAVNSILQARNGMMWGACWGGLVRVDSTGRVEEVLGMRDGFFDREIKGIAEDINGHLWIGNYEGLYRYQPDAGKLIRLTAHDGLMSNNTLDRVFVSHDGMEVFVGQEGGVNIVDIDGLKRRSFFSRLAIGTLKINNAEHTIDISRPLVLTRDQQVISIDFVALNYRNDNHYAVYLEGFDNDWIETGTQHQAYYTNLDPGTYTLHVKVANSFGGWSPETLSWPIRVRPAYYETWWFRIFLIGLIAAAFYGLYQYRIRQLLHVQRVRNRISADLHDELGSTLSGISIMGTLARQNLSHQDPGVLVDRMIEDVAQMSSSLDDIVWNISPKNDSLSDLVARLTRYASELFEARNIRYSFDLPDQADHIKLDMEERRNLYLILKESINNLVKYAHCTEAHISMKILPRHLQVTVADNGTGFDPSAVSARNGIKNMRDRARALNGTLDIESSPGKGTHIRLNVPR